jgi:hypothetical protein
MRFLSVLSKSGIAFEIPDQLRERITVRNGINNLYSQVFLIS